MRTNYCGFTDVNHDMMTHYFVFRSERGFKNVIARDYHCIAYTTDSIYVWGTNFGQFGFPATETKIIQPKKVRPFPFGHSDE